MTSLLLSLLLFANAGHSISFTMEYTPLGDNQRIPFTIHLSANEDQVYCQLESQGYLDFKFLFRGEDTSIILLPAADGDSIAYQYRQDQVNFLISAGLGQMGLRPLVNALQSFANTTPVIIDGETKVMGNTSWRKAEMKNNKGRITCWVSKAAADGLFHLQKQLSGITILHPLLQALEQFSTVGFPMELTYELSNGDQGRLRVDNIQYTVPQAPFDLSAYKVVRY